MRTNDNKRIEVSDDWTALTPALSPRRGRIVVSRLANQARLAISSGDLCCSSPRGEGLGEGGRSHLFRISAFGIRILQLMSILTYILGWPLLGAIALVFVPRNYRVVIRAVAVLATFISMLLAVKMFCQFVPGHAGYQFEQQIPWVESLGISYHVGVDGLNVGLI